MQLAARELTELQRRRARHDDVDLTFALLERHADRFGEPILYVRRDDQPIDDHEQLFGARQIVSERFWIFSAGIVELNDLTRSLHPHEAECAQVLDDALVRDARTARQLERNHDARAWGEREDFVRHRLHGIGFDFAPALRTERAAGARP